MEMKEHPVTQRIKWYPLPDSQYIRAEYPKKQLVLHHTASGHSSKGDIDYWKSNPDRIATPFVIDRDGTLWQCFNSRFYAYHLGTPASTFKKFGVNNTTLKLHQQSIGIEIDSWGWLTKKDGKFYTYAGSVIPEENVQVYTPDYFGQRYFEKYTDAQIETLRQLILYLSDTYGIPLDYKYDMWHPSKEALSGEPGIWSHTSFRESGKWDAHPQMELIYMLSMLTK